MEASFTEEEVWAALSNFSGHKAPMLDGFTMECWQLCWGFVKQEAISFFKECFSNNSFKGSLNATFLVLIQKKGGVEDLKDVESINLVRGLYMLLAKALANKLKKVMWKVVPNYQHAFMKGEQILTYFLSQMRL